MLIDASVLALPIAMPAKPRSRRHEATMSILPDENAAEELIGAVIAEYERAIERGVEPAEALSVLLSFAAEESGRLSGHVLGDRPRHDVMKENGS